MPGNRKSVRLVTDAGPDDAPRVRLNWKAIGVASGIALALLGGYDRFVRLEAGQKATTESIHRLESRIDKIAEKIGVLK